MHAANALVHHRLELYLSDEQLARRVVSFLGAGLADGEAAVAIATPLRQEALLALHRVHGERLIILDARATLELFLRDGAPDRAAFRATIMPVIAAAAARGNGRVRLFGEMVALLVSDGRPEAALQLERLWNGVVAQPDLALLCAYPLRDFEGDNARHLPGVLALHSLVQTPMDPPVPPAGAHRRPTRPPTPAGAQPLAPARDAARILMVDDEPDILEGYRMLLQARLGARVLLAPSGEAGLAILRAAPVDLIVSDHRMPAMDGLEFLRLAHDVAPATPRVLLSAYHDRDVEETARKEGVVRFLSKGSQPGELVAEIRKLVGR